MGAFRGGTRPCLQRQRTVKHCRSWVATGMSLSRRTHAPAGGGSRSLGVPGGRSEFGRRKKVPLAPGCSSLDWIRLKNDKGRELAGVEGPMQAYSEAQVAQHNTQEDAWMAVHGKVYNITPYLRFHPGGLTELMRGAGMDATHLYNEYHKWVSADAFLDKCQVGFLAKGVGAVFDGAISPNEYRELEVIEVAEVSHNCRLVRFSLGADDATLPTNHVAQHVRLR